MGWGYPFSCWGSIWEKHRHAGGFCGVKDEWSIKPSQEDSHLPLLSQEAGPGAKYNSCQHCLASVFLSLPLLTASQGFHIASYQHRESLSLPYCRNLYVVWFIFFFTQDSMCCYNRADSTGLGLPTTMEYWSHMTRTLQK